MTRRYSLAFCALLPAALLVALATPPAPALARTGAEHEVAFSKDIAPILQRSCQKCHRPNALAPMSLIDYDEVRPWARSIKNRTGLRDKPGVMPPWYIEKDIGIQRFKDDPSLSEEEIRKPTRTNARASARGPCTRWDATPTSSIRKAAS